ncbi:hypothetical protein [Actinacidiphila sp. bgisy144]|uniref:hypothetical protein n=1 Tax=Actinacidiphila sp. bgisy144 TaxID=3413791 RepID=UPI003EBEDFA4
MTAQPYEHPRGPIDRPRTVGAIKAALPDTLAKQFQAAIDAADPADLFTLVATWAAVAQTAGDPELDTAAAAVRAGVEPVFELGEVFPALADPR